MRKFGNFENMCLYDVLGSPDAERSNGFFRLGASTSRAEGKKTIISLFLERAFDVLECKVVNIVRVMILTAENDDPSSMGRRNRRINYTCRNVARF